MTGSREGPTPSLSPTPTTRIRSVAMSAPSIVLFPQQPLVLEPSDKVSSPGSLPVEWKIKIAIGEDFRTVFYCRDDKLSASVTFGTRMVYWCIHESTGTFLTTYADGTCARAEDALREATDAMARARWNRSRQRAAQATATV